MQGLEEAQRPRFVQLCGELDVGTDGWTAQGREVFKTAAELPGAINVVVTASKLLAAVAKLMVFNLNAHVDATQIYSVSTQRRRRSREGEAKRGVCSSARAAVLGSLAAPQMAPGAPPLGREGAQAPHRHNAALNLSIPPPPSSGGAWAGHRRLVQQLDPSRRLVGCMSRGRGGGSGGGWPPSDPALAHP